MPKEKKISRPCNICNKPFKAEKWDRFCMPCKKDPRGMYRNADKAVSEATMAEIIDSFEDRSNQED